MFNTTGRGLVLAYVYECRAALGRKEETKRVKKSYSRSLEDAIEKMVANGQKMGRAWAEHGREIDRIGAGNEAK